MTSFLPESASDTLRPHVGGIKDFPVFLSYGDEAMHLKKRIVRVLEEAINRQLSHVGARVHLPVWDWRDVPVGRAPDGGKINDRFVEMARTSSVTIVLLFDRMPPGTQEELLAVKDDKDVDLKVFWINRPRKLSSLRRPTEVARFLNQHKNEFTYLELDDLDSERSWVRLVANVVSVLLKALSSEQRKPYAELR